MSTLASKGPLESKMPALAFYQLKAAILVLSLMITFGTDFWSRILNTFGSKRFFTLFWKCLLSHREFFLFIEFVQIESRPDTSIVRAWTIWESLCPRKFWPWHWTVLFVHLWNFWTGGRICWQFRYLRTLWRLNWFQTGLMCEWMGWKTRSYFGLNGKIGRMHATSYKVARIKLMDAFMIWEQKREAQRARDVLDTVLEPHFATDIVDEKTSKKLWLLPISTYSLTQWSRTTLHWTHPAMSQYYQNGWVIKYSPAPTSRSDFQPWLWLWLRPMRFGSTTDFPKLLSFASKKLTP